MLTTRNLTLLLGVTLILLGAVLVVLAVERRVGSLTGMAIVTSLGSVASLLLAIRLTRRRRYPSETRREQRLWRSGPLGRRWLKSRRRLP